MSYKKRRYYTPAEVSKHMEADDCWVSLFGKVLDLTQLMVANKENNSIIKPILDFAGKDVSHWFNPVTQELRTHVDPDTQMESPYTPQGYFIHLPPSGPRSDWRNDFVLPWWKDPAFCIGSLSQSTRRVIVENTLTGQRHVLEVCSEETINEIKDRYYEFNQHSDSYTWKRIGKELDMTKTLEENNVPNESDKFTDLGIDTEYYLPVLHLFFNDDLTEA